MTAPRLLPADQAREIKDGEKVQTGALKETKMAKKKEPIEVSCSECSTRFRLWVPAEILPEWEKGIRINCVRCGAQHFLRKGEAGFETEAVTAAAARPAVAMKPVAEAIHAAPAQDTILLIEDDMLARRMVENALKDIDLKLFAVKNSTEALNILRKGKVSLIVTDLYLKNSEDPDSKLDGEELLRRITDSGIHIPAIITTGKDIIDDLVLDPKWFQLHVKGFIQKGNPFWSEDLKLKIKEVLYKD